MSKPSPIAAEYTDPDTDQPIRGHVTKVTTQTAMVQWPGVDKPERVKLNDPSVRWLTSADL